MQDVTALLDILVKCLLGHPDGESPHLVIQMTLQKSGIILEIVHEIHNLENPVS